MLVTFGATKVILIFHLFGCASSEDDFLRNRIPFGCFNAIFLFSLEFF